MARRYHILVSNYAVDDDSWSMEFGDYSRAVVAQEMADMKDSDHMGFNFRIVTLSYDTQAAIDSALATLNAESV